MVNGFESDDDRPRRADEGGGVPFPDPYLLGRFSEAPNQNLVAGSSGHAECDSAWSGKGTPPPSSPPATLRLGARGFQPMLAEEAEELIALGEAPAQHGTVAQHLGAQRDHLARAEVEAPVHFLDGAIDLRPGEMRVADGARLHARVVHQALRLEPSLAARLLVEGGARIGRGQGDL